MFRVTAHTHTPNLHPISSLNSTQSSLDLNPNEKPFFATRLSWSPIHTNYFYRLTLSNRLWHIPDNLWAGAGCLNCAAIWHTKVSNNSIELDQNCCFLLVVRSLKLKSNFQKILKPICRHVQRPSSERTSTATTTHSGFWAPLRRKTKTKLVLTPTDPPPMFIESPRIV